MAWSIVIGVVNWWSGCKFLSHGCHYISSPPFIVLSVYPPLLLRFDQLLLLGDLSFLLPPPSLSSSPRHFWNVRSWSPTNCAVEIDLAKKLFNVCAVETVCVGFQPTANSENARAGSWARVCVCVCTLWGTGADVLANFTSHHAETILLNHFKPCAIGVTARLNQLQNASPVSILHCSIDSAVLRALRNQEEEGTKYWKKEICNPGHGLH